MSDKEKSIEEFVKFTCCSEAEAKNYLENAGWKIEGALVTYFDDRDDRVDPSTLGCGPSTDNPERDSENESMQADDEDFVDVVPPRSIDLTKDSSPDKPDVTKPYKQTSNVATLSSLRSTEHLDDEDDDDDQLYYAGGSEHSGQQIMGNDRRADVAGEVFRHLKQMVTVGEIERAGPSQSGRGSRFAGVGYRLGQTPDDTQVVGGKKSDDARPELNLRLYRNGFTIGDEPLRNFSDPQNRETIELLMRGEVPAHLVPPGTKGGSVHVKLEDMRHQRYTGPGNRGHYFTGQGHVLGNVVPEIVRNDQPKPAETVAEPESEKEPPPASPLQVNENEPTTNVAVRLPNGTRSQVHLNLTHTVEDLRRHLTTVHRELSGQEFAIMVSFPPKEISDEKLSVADAGLVNSSIHLRIKKN